MGLEMDQESSGIALVYVSVCEGGEGRLRCGCILLYSILYVTSILLVPSLCTIFNIVCVPSYVTTSGWAFHTIQAPFKKDKDGNPTLGTRSGIFLATRKNVFAISGKIHHQSDLYQTATWTLSVGEFIPIIHITGVYLSPDNKVSTSEIKELYTTLNNNFHTPSPHSPQNLHCH